MEPSRGYRKASYSTIALLFFHATNNYASVGKGKRERERRGHERVRREGEEEGKGEEEEEGKNYKLPTYAYGLF